MTKEIATRDIMTISKEIMKKTSKLNPIITRAADPKALTFKTIDEKALQKIADNMPAINRATHAFGKQNSQTTSKLMTLNMISAGPYRRLKQILAQLERKRSALKENMFKLQKDQIRYDEITKEQEACTVDDDLKWEALEIEKVELASNMADSGVYIEACIKEIGMYQEAYDEILKNHNIPEKWDEADFEEAEIEHHLKQMFTNCVRDVIQNGRMNMGTMEYLEQYGIHPIVAYKLVLNYVNSIDSETRIEEGKVPSIDVHYDFLDKMYEMFKDEYKKALKRSGLDAITHGEYLYKETKE